MKTKNIPTSEVQDKLRQLEERFKNRLTDTLHNIQTLRATSKTKDVSPSMDELLHICHKLAGSAGTFGFTQLSVDMKRFQMKLLNFKRSAGEREDKEPDLLYQEALDILAKAMND